MKFFLKTTYPCLVKTNSQECELDQNDLLEIENEKTLFIYPQNSNSVPFYVNLSSPKDSERASFVSRGEDKLILLEKAQTFSVKTKEKLNFSGKIVEICVENNKITFETSDKKLECKTSSGQDYDCFKIQNFACVKFQDEMFLFSVKNNKIFHFVGESEVDKNQICVTKKFFDSEKREKKTIFHVNEEIELESEEFVYNQNLKETKKIKELSPFKLLESVKAKDYAHAKNFLNEKLQSQIDLAQIEELFGTFSDFLPLSTTEFITINGKNKNFVQFSMENDEICDISVDNLQ